MIGETIPRYRAISPAVGNGLFRLSGCPRHPATQSLCHHGIVFWYFRMNIICLAREYELEGLSDLGRTDDAYSKSLYMTSANGAMDPSKTFDERDAWQLQSLA